MSLYCILRILIWATAVLEARAVVQNVTLAAGASDNITFNGPGWSGYAGWQGPTPENVPCINNTTPPGNHSLIQGVSVTVVFQGIAVYFVGWNNSDNGLYQSYIDGVPDSVVTAYIPASESWVCNVFQYEKTGLANTEHNLTLALLPNDPGGTSSEPPGLSVNGFIITTDDSSAPLPSISGSPVPPVTPSSSAVSPSFSDPSVVPSTLSDSSSISSTSRSSSPIFSTSTDTSPASTTFNSGLTTAVSSTTTSLFHTPKF
ncbi:hypothetical protein B0H11DRAFT_2229021 [Mycena galericulata]|nr:hypothetical protein B0H11DRAFT_2229021 [Mycena galericulata]